MTEKQKDPTVLIRYPQIKGYILKVYELQRLIADRFDIAVLLEDHEERHLEIILDRERIYKETADERAEVDTLQCLEAIRKSGVTEREQEENEQGDRPEEQLDTDDDPDHRRWLNNVCSGE